MVAKLADAFCREGMAVAMTCVPLERLIGPSASALLRVGGPDAEAFATARTGTIRWIGTSPFRPLHKRRNWFVGVSRAPSSADVPELREADIRFQTLRASGPGGQHVNTTDSAVRAVHVPTGLATVSQDQRSQFANKKVALLKMAVLFEDQRRGNEAGGQRALWDQNHALERGNAVLTYEGQDFRRR